MSDSALSGRLDVVETTLGYLNVQMATRPDLAAFQDLSRIINQKLDAIVGNYNIIRSQLQSLNSLYVNLNNTVSLNSSRFTGHTGDASLHQEVLTQISITGDHTLLPNESIVFVSTPEEDTVLTMPSVISSSGLFYYLKKTDNTAYYCQVTGAALIDGSGEYILTGQYSAVNLYSNGSSWNIF